MDRMREFKSYPKEPPKTKKTSQDRQKQWNDMKARSFKKQIEKNKERIDKDKEFFLSCYNHFVEKGEWYCRECETPLPILNESNFSLIRSCCDHILLKSKHDELRYTLENIMPLCGLNYGNNCHDKKGNAISFPKMKIYPIVSKIIDDNSK